MALISLSRHLMTAGVILMLTATACAASLTEEEAARARQLVRQLGAPNYRQREEARAALIKMGAAVEPLLREGMESDIPEVRFRSRTILPLALSFDLDQRLNGFLAGKDEEAPPLWDQFKDLVGDSPETRELFARMHRTEGKLLAGLASDPAAQRSQITARCTEFSNSRNFGGNMPILVDEIALLLFVSQVPRVNLEPNAQSYLSSALHSISYQPRGKEVLRNHDVVRKLLVRYITQGSTFTAYNNMYLIANLELSEGVDIARAILKRSDKDQHTRGMALSLLGRIGSKEQIPELLPYLEDKTSMGETQFGNNQRIRTQLRDVALASLIQLSGQTLADYDFAYLKMFPGQNLGLNLHLSPTLLGFQDDTTRDAALEKWKKWFEANRESIITK